VNSIEFDRQNQPIRQTSAYEVATTFATTLVSFFGLRHGTLLLLLLITIKSKICLPNGRLNFEILFLLV